MTSHHVITFYSIERIENNKKLGRVVERFCIKNKIVGTFFSTPQGVNTTLSGTKNSLELLIALLETKFKLKLKDQTWSQSASVPFKRLKIKCRENLLPLDGNFDPVESRGKHLNASEWNDLVLDPDTIIVDVRNDYESKIGTFKDSTIPNMKNFTEFPSFVENNLKDKIFVVAGGVAANKNIRSILKKLCEEENYQSIFPPIEFCGDNAAMIAMVGLEKFKVKQFNNLNYPAKPRWPLDENATFLKGAGVQL